MDGYCQLIVYNVMSREIYKAKGSKSFIGWGRTIKEEPLPVVKVSVRMRSHVLPCVSLDRE